MNISTIRESGSELCLDLPQDIINKLGIKVGDQYSFSLGDDGSIVLSLLAAPDSGIRTEVVKTAKEKMQSYSEALRVLKER